MYEQMECGEVCKRFHTDEKAGLTQQEAEKRLKADGKNRLKKVREETTIDRIQKQLNDPMIFVLFMAASVSILLREFSDTAIILFVIGLNTMIGVVQEGKAKKAMDALKKMTAPEATVKRNGTYRKIPAEELVKGDVVKVKAGDQVPADIRLFLCKGIEVNESALTGESTAVRKACETMKQEVTASEQKNMLFLSTEIVKGNGEGIVVATGMETELGKIAKMINEQENEMTPLQKRLGDLGKILSKAAVFLCLLLFLMGVLQHRNLLQMLLLSISLAVAAIPEGLPAVVTIVLALGVARMAKANTIIRKLPAVETLGAVSVVCSDKTGTLTENKMKVLKLYAEDKTLSVSQVRPREFSRLMQGFLLCNNAVIGKTELGDSTELALLSMGEQMGISRERLEERYPRLEEIPFDLSRISREVLVVIEQMAAEQNIRIVWEKKEITHRKLIGSPGYVKRVMMNILSNAVKYNRKNGHIYISCREIPSGQPEMTTIEFVCRDTGIGMTDEFQKHIFEPFAQEHAGSRTKFAGTGLGMPIAKKLIETMGGTITFESENGAGTTFVIRIPFKIDLNSDKREEKKDVSDGKPIKGLHILLAEDNELNMEIAEFVLQNEGAVVTKAWNGQEAVERFKKSEPGEFDAILMDIMMPVMNGYEAAKTIRSMDRKDAKVIPIIAMTANAFAEDRIKAKEAGMDEHIAKPVDEKLLVKVIYELEERSFRGIRNEKEK